MGTTAIPGTFNGTSNTSSATGTTKPDTNVEPETFYGVPLSKEELIFLRDLVKN